jgi:two-component system CheB/CheR fusion protein
VRKQGIAIKNGDANGNGDAKSQAVHLINLEVSPIRMGPMKELYFMIVFHEEKESKPALKPKLSRSAPKQAEVNHSRIAKLEQELSATKEYLQSVIETQEATNEELQSANEEILSSNEELQSTNEELETAKEELQSANEELSTVNDELRNRNADISTVNNDLTNLLASIKIAVIMVAPDLTIRRFTPEAQKTLGLIPADVGRPFININPLIQIPNLHEMILKVIGNGQMIETEAVSRNDHRYLLRIHPYRTSEGKTDGAVITLVDLSPREATESPAE